MDRRNLVFGGVGKIAYQSPRWLHILVQVQTVFDNWASVRFLTFVIHSRLVVPDFPQILKLPLLHLLNLEVVIDSSLALLRVHAVVPRIFGNGHESCLLLSHLHLGHTLVNDWWLLVLDISLVVIDGVRVQIGCGCVHSVADSLRVPGASNSIRRLAYEH